MSFWRRRSIFDIFDEMMRDIEEMFYDLEREFERFMVERRGGKVEPLIYGFRIYIGPDGKPVIEEFGNVKRKGRRTVIKEEVEPLVDVFEDEDKVTIVAELPGVDKDKIDIRITKDNKLIIRARDENRKYYKEIELPAKVKPETAKAKYKNGVLEIVIEKEKPKEESEEGIKIKVE